MLRTSHRYLELHGVGGARAGRGRRAVVVQQIPSSSLITAPAWPERPRPSAPGALLAGESLPAPPAPKGGRLKSLKGEESRCIYLLSLGAFCKNTDASGCFPAQVFFFFFLQDKQAFLPLRRARVRVCVVGHRTLGEVPGAPQTRSPGWARVPKPTEK